MAKNVLGGELYDCSVDPVTGWLRDGSCRTDAGDRGQHVVCVVLTAEFLEFSKSVGNDLTTPQPAFHFPGLEPGDRWCMGAARWVEARDAGFAPAVVLEATHAKALEWIGLSELEQHRF
jgi:uncharacterized protein (DUF2237 family)